MPLMFDWKELREEGGGTEVMLGERDIGDGGTLERLSVCAGLWYS